MKIKIIVFVLLILGGELTSQNKQILYNFADIPQTQLINPGIETNYKYHIGMPFFSGISTSIGSSGATISDLLLDDNINFNTKFSKLIHQLKETDDLSITTQIELFNLGYRIRPDLYLSAGFYEELDAMGYIPKDILIFLYEGNAAYLNRSFSFSQLNFKLETLGVLHFGATKRMNRKLTIGARFKIYSSSFNLKTTNNTGTLTTSLGNNNLYRHTLDNVHINLQSAGLMVDGEPFYEPDFLYKDTFLSGNLGIGIDAGFTYLLNPKLEVSGSIVDLGVIKYSKNTHNTTVEGTYVTEGINFQYDPNNPKDYWSNLETDFKENVTTNDNEDSYISWRSTKLHAAIKHRFGEVRLNKDCYDPAYQEYYSNAIGLQLYTIFRPLQPQFALTGFFEKSFSQNFHTKVTYTIDRYSAANFGVGFAAKIWKFQFYGMLDNLLKLTALEDAHNASFQLGINLIFN